MLVLGVRGLGAGSWTSRGNPCATASWARTRCAQFMVAPPTAGGPSGASVLTHLGVVQCEALTVDFTRERPEQTQSAPGIVLERIDQ